MLILGRRLRAPICQGSTSMQASQGKATTGSWRAAPRARCWRRAADCVWHADHQALLHSPGVLHFAWKSKHRATQRSKELILCAETQHLPSRKHWRGRHKNCEQIASPYSPLVPPQSLQQSRVWWRMSPTYCLFFPHSVAGSQQENQEGEKWPAAATLGPSINTLLMKQSTLGCSWGVHMHQPTQTQTNFSTMLFLRLTAREPRISQ